MDILAMVGLTILFIYS